MNVRRVVVAVVLGAGVCSLAGSPAAEAGPPAQLAGAATMTFQGDAHLGCFGCGSRADGNFYGTATGVGTGGVGAFTGPMQAVYAYTESSTNPQCVITGNAAGSFNAGVYGGYFTWTRLGAVAVFTTSAVNGGGLSNAGGGGTAAFVVTSPIGDPCGMPVTARVIGEMTLV